VLVIVFTIWRAFHGPYSDEAWQSFKQSIRHRLARKRAEFGLAACGRALCSRQHSSSPSCCCCHSSRSSGHRSASLLGGL
jgi:hypothetical protein